MVVVGVGARARADGADLAALADKVLADLGLAAADVGVVATIDRRADHEGVRRLAASCRAELVSFDADLLAAQPIAHPSDVVDGLAGTPSVAEAAVLASGARPLTPPVKADGWVVVIGRRDEPDLLHHGDTEVAPGMLDFAVNVHAPQPPEFLRRRLIEAVSTLGSYPDRAAATDAVARAHGVPPECVLLTNGAAEAFTLVARLGHRKPLVVHPQFTEPEAALREAGHDADRLILNVDSGFSLPSDMEEGHDLVVVGNPTNPTSRLHDPAALTPWLREDRLMLVDEAFMDAVEDLAEPAYSLVQQAATTPGLAVVRSLTKTYSLAGGRIGYVVAHPDLVRRLDCGRGPWPVNSVALAAAEACVSEEGRAHAASVRAELPARLAHLTAGLSARGFYVTEGARGPFVLARHPRAAGIRDHLRQHGIAVRRGDTFPGLGPDWLRIAAREPNLTDRLLSAIDLTGTIPSPTGSRT